MRRRTGGLLAMATLVLSATACGSEPPGALAGDSPSQILAAALAAGEAQAGVHYLIKATGPSQSQTQTVTGDAGPDDGTQSVVTGKSEVDVVLLPDHTAYLRGNAAGLQQTVGFPAAQSSTYAGKWISLSPKDSLYSAVTQLITLRGILTQLSPSGRLAKSTPGRLVGHEVIGVRGGLPGTTRKGVTGSAALYVSTSKPTVPIGFTGEASNSSTTVNDVGAFTHWGEQLHLTAPTANPVPYSSIAS